MKTRSLFRSESAKENPTDENRQIVSAESAEQDRRKSAASENTAVKRKKRRFGNSDASGERKRVCGEQGSRLQREEVGEGASLETERLCRKERHGEDEENLEHRNRQCPPENLRVLPEKIGAFPIKSQLRRKFFFRIPPTDGPILFWKEAAESRGIRKRPRSGRT